MKHLNIILFLLMMSVAALAQTFSKPDYKDIEKQVTDMSSPLHYQKLFARFQSADSTLTASEYSYLYYGTLYSDGYSPYAVSKHSAELKPILAKNGLAPEDIDKLIEVEQKVLADMPFSIRDLNILAFAYSKKGDKQAEERTRRKLFGIINAIMSSGDGKTEKTAFHVISVAHEYELLPALGVRFGGKQSLTDSKCDYLELAPNEKGIKGLYFDVSAVFNATAKMFNK